MTEAVMIVAPGMAGEQYVERSERFSPGEVAALFEPFRVLGQHRVDDLRERFVRRPQAVASGQQVALEATNRRFMAQTVSIDDQLSPDGRVLEVLSEHCCEGWLEGYLLTGRHGLWSSYEAFAQVVDSMLTQHAKWLE